MRTTPAPIPFETATALMRAALDGPFRSDELADLRSAPTLREALGRLRERMRTNRWAASSAPAGLAGLVADYDARTRAQGLHALHDWDGVADHINPNSIPVEVLDYVAERCGTEANDLAALAILIDYHFLYVLSLLSLRIWDDGDPSANLQQLGQLLTILQGPHGSRHRFADDAATLLLFATSHFEQDERGYDGLLVRVRDLDRAQQLAIAFGHAAALGSHLRFGFEATYGRDIAAARDDNRADYPWLAFSLAAQIERIVNPVENVVPMRG